MTTNNLTSVFNKFRLFFACDELYNIKCTMYKLARRHNNYKYPSKLNQLMLLLFYSTVPHNGSPSFLPVRNPVT